PPQMPRRSCVRWTNWGHCRRCTSLPTSSKRGHGLPPPRETCPGPAPCWTRPSPAPATSVTGWVRPWPSMPMHASVVRRTWSRKPSRKPPRSRVNWRRPDDSMSRGWLGTTPSDSTMLLGPLRTLVPNSSPPRRPPMRWCPGGNDVNLARRPRPVVGRRFWPRTAKGPRPLRSTPLSSVLGSRLQNGRRPSWPPQANRTRTSPANSAFRSGRLRTASSTSTRNWGSHPEKTSAVSSPARRDPALVSASAHPEATGDTECLPGDVRGLFRGQERDGGGDLVGAPQAAQLRSGLERLDATDPSLAEVATRLEEWGIDCAWGDGVDGDAVASVLAGDGLGEGNDASLRRRVDRTAFAAHASGL